MKTLSIHPVDYLRSHHHVGYLKSHLDYEETRKRLLKLLKSLFKKVCESTEKVEITAVVFLIVALFIFVFIRLGECYTNNAFFYDACEVIPLIPIFFIP